MNCATCGALLDSGLKTFCDPCIIAEARRQSLLAPAERLKEAMQQSAKTNAYILQNIPLEVYAGALVLTSNT